MSNGTFVLDWVENGEKATRSPGCKTSSCGSDPWRMKLELLPSLKLGENKSLKCYIFQNLSLKVKNSQGMLYYLTHVTQEAKK